MVNSLSKILLSMANTIYTTICCLLGKIFKRLVYTVNLFFSFQSCWFCWQSLCYLYILYYSYFYLHYLLPSTCLCLLMYCFSNFSNQIFNLLIFHHNSSLICPFKANNCMLVTLQLHSTGIYMAYFHCYSMVFLNFHCYFFFKTIKWFLYSKNRAFTRYLLAIEF